MQLRGSATVSHADAYAQGAAGIDRRDSAVCEKHFSSSSLSNARASLYRYAIPALCGMC
jgi:hypothetical protein